MIYITSDWHFCHNKSFLYEPRGFTNVEDMDEAIITNHNSIVSENDDVYHLGDEILCDIDKGIECIKRLNGNIHLIVGNHSTNNKIGRIIVECPNVVEVKDIIILKYCKYKFYLSHYPTLCGYDDGRPLKKQCVSLCGHSHYRNPFRDMDKGLIYHCELDCNSIQPISIDKIIEELEWFSTLPIERKKQIISMDVYNV